VWRAGGNNCCRLGALRLACSAHPLFASASQSPVVAHNVSVDGSGSRTGSGLILARIALNVLMRGDRSVPLAIVLLLR
jgi:hypothetical protein